MKSGTTLRVLTYHRIITPEQAYPHNLSLISATPAMFARHMEMLARHYNVIDMPTALAAFTSGDRLPQRAVLITFDDAYPDFLEHAWPVLREHRLPATLFVPTAYPDMPGRWFWWDRLYAAVMTTTAQQLDDVALGHMSLATPEARRLCAHVVGDRVKQLPHDQAMLWVDDICQQLPGPELKPAGILGWDELRALAGQGITIGAHSRTHPLMTRIPAAQIREEIRGSLQDIRDRIGECLPVFCYPAGAYNRETCEIAGSEGIVLGFSTRLGHNHIEGTDPLSLRRINISPRTTPLVLRGRLSRLGIHADIWRQQIKFRLRNLQQRPATQTM